MSSFRKNRVVPNITEQGANIINKAEELIPSVSINKHVKEITIPFTQEMSDLLEKIFNHFEGDISRRKLCAKFLLKSLRSESERIS